MTDNEFDAIVLGGGPGGMVTALNMASTGLSVALIEDRLIGGECHYWACIPTKTLLRPIEVLKLAKAVPGAAEAVSDGQVNIAAVLAKRDAVIDHLSDQEVVAALRQAGITVFHGSGRLDGARTVRVRAADDTETVLTAREAVVVATGTRPDIPEIPGLMQSRPWTNRDLATMTHVPTRTVVVGGGVVGVEFATILAGLGSAVTLLCRSGVLLRNSEPEASELVLQSLQDAGVEVHFDAELTTVDRAAPDAPVIATFGDQTIEVDEVVIATGRRPNTDHIGLDTVGLPAGEFIAVNDQLQATGIAEGWLYALGDTTGRALLSHISQYHARIVAEIVAAQASGRQLSEIDLAAHDSGSLAQVIFTDPQVVEVGRTERQARAEGFAVRTRTALYPESVGQLALFRDDFSGWAKLVIDADTNALLGATFVGPEFSELVHAATVAVVAKLPTTLLRHAVAPHPTVNQVWDPLLAQESELSFG